MSRHISDILWEDREQKALREIRAAKARFFRNLLILTGLSILLFLIS